MIIKKSLKICDGEIKLIGGAVRNLLLNQKVSKDIDLVTLGSGIKMAKLISKKLNNIPVKVFKSFGTAMILIDDLEFQFVGKFTHVV